MIKNNTIWNSLGIAAIVCGVVGFLMLIIFKINKHNAYIEIIVSLVIAGIVFGIVELKRYLDNKNNDDEK